MSTSKPHRPDRKRSRVEKPSGDDPMLAPFLELKRDVEISAAIGGFFGEVLGRFIDKSRADSKAKTLSYHLYARDEE